MIGMHATTGRTVRGFAHLCQSITTILTTPIGSRLMRREFGSELSNLIDAPNNSVTHVRLYADMATALMRWEPRVKVLRIRFIHQEREPSQQIIEIEGTTTATGESLAMCIPLTTALIS